LPDFAISVSGHPESKNAILPVLLRFIAGCRQAPPPAPAPPAPVIAAPDAPKGDAIADLILREARQQADAILDDMLAGKLQNDPDTAPVAKKLKGYQSASIKSQEIIREGAAKFGGVLTKQTSQHRFEMILVKQQNGNWAIGTFSGPNPE
jgi:hypothetical protein